MAIFAAPQRHATFFFFIVVISLFPLYFHYLVPPPVCIIYHSRHQVLTTKYTNTPYYLIAVTKPIMQFLPVFLAVLYATATLALPEDEKPQGLNLHRATSWTSSLRSFLQADTRLNEEYHELEPQPSLTPSRIYHRRRRFHP